MKNTIPEVQFSRSTEMTRTESQRRSLYRKSAIRAGILNTLAALAATACVDDPGTFKPGREVTAGISADSGSTETASAAADASSSTTADTSSAGETADAATAADTASAETPDTNQPIDTGITPDIKADTGTSTDSGSAPTPDVKADTQKTDVKVYKPAPPDQTLSEFKEGTELPVQQLFLVTKGKVYDAFEAFGHKPGVTPWNNNFSKNVNGADVYTLKMADLPQDPAVAGKGNFRVVTVRLSAGTKSGTYVDSLTGKKAQDGVTPLWDRAPILPVLCEGEYTADDAKLLAEAMTMTGKMEFNDNLQMMRDTYLAYLQQNINVIFANAGKSYAPQCMVQLVTPGDVKIVDGQDCPQGCLYAMVTAQLLAKWTELIPKK